MKGVSILFRSIGAAAGIWIFISSMSALVQAGFSKNLNSFPEYWSAYFHIYNVLMRKLFLIIFIPSFAIFAYFMSRAKESKNTPTV